MTGPAAVVPWLPAGWENGERRISDLELPDGVTWTTIAQGASELLFKMSGARWPGSRTDTIRPHRLNDDCRCDMSGIGAYLGWGWSGIGGWWNRLFPEGWGCACVSSSQYVLPGGQVDRASIVVTVDGQVLDATQWDLVDRRRLVRRKDPTTGSYLSWPCCQRIETPDGDPGTWSIQYAHGDPPPEMGALAAREMSIQLGMFIAAKASKLPAKTTRVNRQGIDITIEAGNLLKDGKTGFAVVDLFLAAYNPKQLKRRARVYSPDSIAPAITSTTQP